ncbi:MAG: carboxymuconolactone decarboxylase family protein, partial [Nitrospinota bacterium]
MPHIDPLPREEIRDPELVKMLEECEDLQVPDSLFPRILAHVPGHAKALLKAMLMSHTRGNVDHRLKEIIRLQLARTAQDTYFANLRSQRARREGMTEEQVEAGSGDYESDPGFTEAEKWALRYADWMYRDPKKVDAAFYDEMKKHYSEAQIMELGAFIALHYGMQVFMRT